MISLFLFLVVVNQTPEAPQAQPLSEAQLNYEFHCKSCHEPGQPGIPDIALLRKLSPETIVKALETGKMKPMGATLTPDERRAIAAFITQN